MAEKLADMLEASITRRFPKGLKVHVHSIDRFGCLASFTAMLRDAGLAITRAKVLPRFHPSVLLLPAVSGRDSPVQFLCLLPPGTSFFLVRARLRVCVCEGRWRVIVLVVGSRAFGVLWEVGRGSYHHLCHLPRLFLWARALKYLAIELEIVLCSRDWPFCSVCGKWVHGMDIMGRCWVVNVVCFFNYALGILAVR